MVFVEAELWAVNTRFSCLCTFDGLHSFVPRWRPDFISAYAAEDRCHLNGLALRDGQPRYVTALGTADTKGGWREHKADGGVLIDLQSNTLIGQGLCMPHSPRWHQDRLWFLESGRGSLSTLDPETGETSLIAEMPGFTRGLDFIGKYALVGLSQVRESLVFSGLPITRVREERNCGVWVIDTDNGEIAGMLRFEDQVQEVFAVQVLRQQAFPQIVDGRNRLTSSSFVLPEFALAELAHAQTANE